MSDKELIAVTWKDACSHDPWTHVDEISSELSIIFTVGMLVKETDETITIALNHDVSSDSFSCFIHIPQAWIVKRELLTKKRARKS